MNRIILLLVCSLFFIFSSNIFSQESQDTLQKWDYGGNASLNISQALFSNWAKGGESSYSGTSLFTMFANRKGNQFLWENKLDLGYGLMYTDQNGSRKTEDNINLNSKIGYNWLKNVNVTGVFAFRSQMAPGYEFPDDSTVVSRFLAPGEFIFSLGLDWQHEDWLNLYFSPTTGRFIVVMDQTLADLGSFGVKPAIYDEEGNKNVDGENFDAQFGWYATVTVKKALMENIVLNSKMDLFQNYTDENPDTRWNIDVNWETTVNMKVNKLISANIFFHVIYDHDVKLPVYETIDGVEELVRTAPRTQIKEVLGIGFSYKF